MTELSTSSFNYVTLIFGLTRLMVAFYAFFLVGIKVQRTTSFSSFAFVRVFILFLGLWELSKAIYFLYPQTEHLTKLLTVVHITTPFISLTYFYFCLTYAFPQKIALKHLAWFALIPCITVSFLLVSDLNKYYLVYTRQLVYVPHREIVCLFGPWFSVQALYSCLIVVAGIICLLTKIRHPGTQNKKFVVYSIIATLLFLFSNVYRFFCLNGQGIWFMPILSIAVITIFYCIIYTDDTSFFIDKGQEQLMKTIIFPVFFLNKDSKIIYANNEALKVCPNLQPGASTLGYEKDIIENFSPYTIDSNLNEEESSCPQDNFLLQSKKDKSLYYVYQKAISTTKKRNANLKQGKMMMMVTVSSLQNLFSQLENKAFKDSLCGCYNRHFLELKKTEHTSTPTEEKGAAEEHILPVTFIMCDIDRLKMVNDNYGHDAGNEYIVLCHDIIKSTIRQDDWIFRLGGDEFLVILPQTERKVGLSIVEKIEEKMELERKPYPTSISVGAVTVEQPPIDYKQCIEEADRLMYQKKQQRKQNQDV